MLDAVSDLKIHKATFLLMDTAYVLSGFLWGIFVLFYFF